MAYDPRALLIKAYASAMAKKPADWRRMQIAVLKNRLIQLSQHEFDETKHGVESFREFLASYPDLVRVDLTGRPAFAEFLGDLKEPPASELVNEARVETGRVREDLWNAVMDYSSKQTYVWDGKKAVPQGEAAPGAKVLPTISEEDLARWRADFAERALPTLVPDQADRLRAWQREGQPTLALPRPLRLLWNTEMKRRVWQALERWFKVQQIPLPEDVFQTPEEVEPELETLRSVVIECVRSMTLDEVKALSLPPAAVARARGRMLRMR